MPKFSKYIFGNKIQQPKLDSPYTVFYNRNWFMRNAGKKMSNSSTVFKKN